MFGAYVYEISSAEYETNVLLIDEDRLEEKTGYSSYFSVQGFRIIKYENDLIYRSRIEGLVKNKQERILMIANPDSYIPYDVQKIFQTTKIGIARLFPKLNANALWEETGMDYNLLTMAYRKNYSDLSTYKATKDFIRDEVFGKENVREYLQCLCKELEIHVDKAASYRDWFFIAEKKAEIQVMAAQYKISVELEELCGPFINYILKNFGKLSAEMGENTPVLVSRAMDYMHDHSKKFVLIVMDGMSEFDWKILSRSFGDVEYDLSHVMAMIPTVTSISRQCLLSNKFPLALENPWSQSKEKKEFIDCARRMGYSDVQIGYDRGYEAEFGAAVSCAAIIINDADDMVHGQLQGRTGMYNDISLLMQQERLVGTVKRMLQNGFDVYISSDHGNVPCTGMGKLMKTGVETETKGHRMVVLKDFADKSAILDKYPSVIEYPGYYLNKEFTYLLCGIGESFDAKGEEVMNHGGITIDEVIVPFIKIKAVNNNG